MSTKNSFIDSIKYSIDEEVSKKQILYNRYKKYISTLDNDGYKDYFIENISSEFALLKQTFPNVDFYCRARIKSYESYRNKVDQKLSEHFSGNIYDTYAKKYIIRSVENSTDENTLISMCYTFARFLSKCSSEYREIPEKRKDYIANPKNTSYQSLHITKKHHHYPDLFIESQIKTESMEDNAKFGEASHSNVYKDRAISIQRVPIYLVPTSFTDSNGKYIVYEQSFEEAFEYFFGINYSEYEATILSI